MQIIFFGTPDYVLPILSLLHKKFVTGPGKSPIVAVVTTPPKPIGRKQILTYSPVDAWAYEHNIEIRHDFNKILPEADLGIVASYGGLIPKKVIDRFPHGVLVVHPSLLPKFRWASPVPAAIVTNQNPTGITIMKMDEKFDHGPIITQSKEEILETDTTLTLRNRLFEKSAAILVEMLEPYIKGKIKAKKQDHSQATFARELKKEDAFIPSEYLALTLKGSTLQGKWKIPFITDYEQSVSAENIERFVRAMQPWPVAWTLLRLSATEGQARRLKILKAHVENEELLLDEVQLEGKNPVSFRQLLMAYPNLSFETK